MGYIGTVPALENINPVGTNSVETQDLQNAAVTTDKIANDTVTTDKIATSAVTAAKLAPGAAVPTQTGQTGKFLTTDGTTASWQTVVSGPTISSLAYSGNDLATDTTTPLPVTIIGSGFVANSKVYIDTITNANSATALQFSGTTQITFTPPAKSAASYNVWVVTPTGQMAVLVNGILYSGTPNWAGVNTSYASSTAVSIQLTAAGTDTPLTYSLVSGTLPTGVTLSSSGLLSGTVTGLLGDTTFSNIVIRASDAQNQDASITIQLTINLIAQISRSLRFNSADSAYLTRTFAGAGNQKTWTWSGWVKLSALGTNRTMFERRAGASDSSIMAINFGDGSYGQTKDAIIIARYSYYNLITTQVFRDSSAWYHIVLSADTTQATASNRLKLYVNGEQITAFSSTTYPSLNEDLPINAAAAHDIGRATYFDGYMAEVNFVDGQQLSPSSFGQINSNTGVWAPLRYSGAYGTNGFYLNFADNSAATATTLGKDNSGNNNNWTPNNFSVTAGVGNDSMVDSPTSYGVDTGLGEEVRGNYCTLNPLARGQQIQLSDGNLTAIAGNSQYYAVLGTIGAKTGKWYFEMQLQNGVAAPDIGFHQAQYTESQLTSFDYATRPGSYCIATSGNGTNIIVFNNGTATQITSSGTTWATNDIIGCAIDMDAKKIWFHRNGSYYAPSIGGTAGNPAAGTNPAITYTYSGDLLPRGSAYSNNYTATYNFGQRPFAYTAPSGYKALCTQNLPTPTIGATSTTLANKYFNDIIWTGNGVNPRQITGVGFQPDLVWTVRRDVGYGNWLYDVLRGPSKPLKASDTSAEATYTQVSSFDADGFTQSGTNDQANNVNGGQYVAWNWKAGGAGVSNTQGSITSTVSANTTSGFSIVTWTGNGAEVTVGHGLGAVPSLIIHKFRSAISNWSVYTATTGAGKRLKLNSTDAVATDGSFPVAPTSTVFSINGGSNDPGVTMLAYCFAAVPGYSAFGSYTGNGSSDGPFVYCGFRPAYVIIKRMDAAGNWQVFDSARSSSNTAGNVLFVNSTEGEVNDSNRLMDFVSNGFKLRAGAPVTSEFNGNGASFVFAAFAETPFKYALAR